MATIVVGRVGVAPNDCRVELTYNDGTLRIESVRVVNTTGAELRVRLTHGGREIGPINAQNGADQTVAGPGGGNALLRDDNLAMSVV